MTPGTGPRGALSNKAKGNAFERRIAEYLRSCGWTVDVAVDVRTLTHGRGKSGCAGWITRKCDFFGAVDVIAVHEKKPYTLFVQATTSRKNVAKKKRTIGAIKWNGVAHRAVVVTEGKEPTSFEVYYLAGDNWMVPRSFVPRSGRPDSTLIP